MTARCQHCLNPIDDAGLMGGHDECWDNPTTQYEIAEDL